MIEKDGELLEKRCEQNQKKVEKSDIINEYLWKVRKDKDF